VKKKKILVTGATGQVGLPFSLCHAAENELWAIARFSDQGKRDELEAAGVHCRQVDLLEGDFSSLPNDFDAVFHFAVARSGGEDFDSELRENAEATGALMSFCRDAGSFFYCSSSAVYQSAGDALFSEDSPLGDHHRCLMPTYSIGKIAAEAVVRFCAREYQLPTLICRLNTPYGESGWPFYHLLMMKQGAEIPLHSDCGSRYTLIHQDDINRLAPQLLSAASVPAAVFNFSGQEHVGIAQWCDYIAELTGLEAKYCKTVDTLQSVCTDNSKMQAHTGPASVSWREGIRAMVERAGALK